MKIGASATLGTFWNSTTNGYSARPASRRRTMTSAIAMRPRRDQEAEQDFTGRDSVACISVSHCATSDFAISDGAGMMKADMAKIRTAASPQDDRHQQQK